MPTKKIKLQCAIIVAKLTNRFVTFFRLGAGLTLPGYYALKIFPKLFESHQINFKNGIILISGTNGKTTTSKITAHILESHGLKVLNNKSGSNVLNGLASVLLLDMDFLGNQKSDVAVLEVDEFYLSKVLPYLSPRFVVLLNLTRDQLDRYGEVDIVYDRWKAALSKLEVGNSGKTTLVVDVTQNIFLDLPAYYKGTIKYFDDTDALLKHTSLIGYYNAKNVNAAVEVCKNFGLDSLDIRDYLKDFNAAYGRGEIIFNGDKKFRILLAKNPASFNQNLDVLIKKEIDPDALVFILNDKIPDGRDVSWIYDIEPEKLLTACEGREIFVTGKRYLDMAVRLNYSGVETVRSNIAKNISVVFDVINKGGLKNILVLPNYSAMLETRKLMTGKKIL